MFLDEIRVCGFQVFEQRIMIEPLATEHELDSESIRSQLPEGPGVYFFKDSSGEVIYVGKAKNLKKRVLSYFRQPDDLARKTTLMMHRARSLEYILTFNEKEAFILESNLIKKHIPRYNIILRDDKQYPWVRLAAEEDYPNLTIVRKPRKDGAFYFGPFSSAQAVRSTMKLIDRIFQEPRPAEPLATLSQFSTGPMSGSLHAEHPSLQLQGSGGTGQAVS